MAELSKLQREIISRCTMGVIALALLYGEYRCIATGMEWSAQFREQHENIRGRRASRASGAGYAYLGGGLLLLGGGVFGLMAIVPAETFARLMGPPVTNRMDWDS